MADDEMTDDVRGSAPVMSTKDLLLEVYHDMKVIRPQVESLTVADLPHRVGVLEGYHIASEAASKERGRIGDISQRTLLTAIVLINFFVGLFVVVLNNIDLTAILK